MPFSRHDNTICTVILADDHGLILQAVEGYLQRNGSYEVISMHEDGNEALQAILEKKPDLAILDNSMPRLTGIEIARELHRSGKNDTLIVLLTMYAHPHLLTEAKRWGISACVSKEDATAELGKALAAAKAGDFYVSPKLAEEIKQAPLNEAESVSLTPREKQILATIVDGMTNKEIADLLGLSTRTVDHHRERLMRKIGARNTADVVRYAAQMGMRLK